MAGMLTVFLGIFCGILSIGFAGFMLLLIAKLYRKWFGRRKKKKKKILGSNKRNAISWYQDHHYVYFIYITELNGGSRNRYIF